MFFFSCLSWLDNQFSTLWLLALIVFFSFLLDMSLILPLDLSRLPYNMLRDLYMFYTGVTVIFICSCRFSEEEAWKTSRRT